MYKFDEKALCLNMDTNLFFDQYEENPEVSKKVDLLCIKCPAQRQCLAYGVSNAEWGVWGGVYLEGGKISKEFEYLYPSLNDPNFNITITHHH
jgi:hypothetical protein